MGNTVKRLSELNTIIFEATKPFKVPDDPMATTMETSKFLASTQGPIFRVIDITEVVDTLDFSNLMLAMAEERGKPGGADDPNVTTLFVGSGELVKIGAEALKEQEQYGKANVHLFESQEDALAFVREQAGEQK